MEKLNTYIATKCTELHSHLLDAKQRFERGALGSSDDYLCALEVIGEMKDHIMYDFLQWEDERE